MTLRIKARGLTLLIGLTLLATSIGTSFAVGPVVTGIVKDIQGNILPGATVSDGRTSSTTDADGRYTIIETSQGTYTFTASKSGYVSQSKSVNTLSNTEDLNFALKYKIYPDISPLYFNTLPKDLAVTADSAGPSSMSVILSMPNVGNIALGYTGVVHGMNRWSATVTVPLGAVDGTHNSQFSGSIGGDSVTDTPSYPYVLDRVLPVFGVAIATPNGSDVRATRSSTPLLAIGLTDDRAGINTSSITAEITDVTGTVVSSGTGTYQSSQARFQVPSSSSLIDGRYTASISASDKAGNATSTTFDFLVDTVLPSALFGYPNDDVSTTTPEIGATVTDSGPATLNTPTLSISGASPATPAFNASNGHVTYTPTFPLTVGQHTATVVAADSAGNTKTLAFPFWVLQTLAYDQLTRTYLPTTPTSPCSGAGTSLLTSFNGRGVSAMQIKHGVQQTKAADQAGSWLFADTLAFSWSPTLGAMFLHEIFADGIPIDASQGVFAPGQPCGSPPDIHPFETTSKNSTTHSRSALGPGGSGDAPVASGTYSWRVKDNVARQSTESDRLSVLSVVGKWSADQSYFVSSAVNTAWIPSIEAAAALWGTASTFQYHRINSCPSEGCDYVNQIVPVNMGSNGPLGTTQYSIGALGTGAPDTLGCCFIVTVNSGVPMSINYPPQAGSYDLFSVMAHELGHAAGVGHDFTYPASMMNNVLGHQWVRRSLLPFDKNTMSYLYP